MREYMHRHYTKEEEFLEEFEFSAAVVAAFLQGAWQPNPHCNDAVRRNAKLMPDVESRELVFEHGTAFHTQKAFSSALIVLRSSVRLVTVRVKWKDGKLVAEQVSDSAREKERSV